MWADEPRTDEVRIGWRGVVGSNLARELDSVAWIRMGGKGN